MLSRHLVAYALLAALLVLCAAGAWRAWHRPQRDVAERWGGQRRRRRTK